MLSKLKFHSFCAIKMILSFLLVFCFFVKCEAFDLNTIDESKIISEKNITIDNKYFIDNIKLAESSNKVYLIFEDAETLEATNEVGEKNISINFRPTPYKRRVKNISELYAMNLAYEDEFKNLMESLQRELGGKLVLRPSIKSQKRVQEKTQIELNGDYNKITDMWAASLIFPNEDKLLNAFEKIKNRDDVVKIRDRWNNPLPQGYRDIKLNFALSNGAIVELQLHHKAIMQVKNGIDHDIYEFVRSNKDNSEMKSYVERAKNLQIVLYESVWNGNFENINESAKKILEETTKDLAKQNCPKKSEIILNRLEEIFEYNFDKKSLNL